MYYVTALALIVCGVLAASSVIIKKKPDAKALIDKIVPFQGWIGLVVCLWGVWTIINAILNLSLLTWFPPRGTIWWITYMGTGVVEFGLGFLLGYGMIQKLILSKNEEAKKKGEELLAKLAGIQIPLGFAGIGLGIWCLVGIFILL